jgi:FkbM family methyltransferase
VIFDVGAHVGDITKIYRRCFPLATIHCFEPSPQSLHDLRVNLKDDSRSHCHNVALSEKNGTGLLNINMSPGTNSLLPSAAEAAFYWGEALLDTISQVEVKTTTVDSFCHEQGISHMDILKMDVQGGEYSVLLGAKGMLSNKNIALIYTEIIICPTYEGQHKLHDYLALLDSYGYSLLDFYHPIWHHHQLIQCDAIFLNSSSL